MGGQSIESHQSSHGTASNEGMLPIRQGLEIFVYKWLELIYEPLHGFFATPFKWATKLLIIKVIRRILRKPAIIRTGITLYSSNYDRCFYLIKIFTKSPAFAIGSMAVIKNIVPVKHI